LLDAHGIKTTDMQWFVSGREVFIGHELPVKVQRIEPPPPFGGEKLVLSKMLSEGRIARRCSSGRQRLHRLFRRRRNSRR
jgi:hypothetical protein